MEYPTTYLPTSQRAFLPNSAPWWLSFWLFSTCMHWSSNTIIYSLAYKYLDSFFSFQDGLETPYKGVSFLSFKKPAWNLVSKIVMLSAWGKRRRKKQKGGERRRGTKERKETRSEKGRHRKGKKKEEKKNVQLQHVDFS